MAANSSVLGERAHNPASDTGGLGGDTAVYAAVQTAREYLPDGVRVLKQHAATPVRGSRDAVAAVRLLWEISQEKVAAPVHGETRATGKLLLVDVTKATELLRDERMAEQRERQR